MFPWWVRLFIFLPLAALQIILLTISALGWQYEVEFEQFMILLGDMVSSALQLNLIEAVIRDVLASWNIVLPELGKHWHHVFVLQWLWLSALARLDGAFQNLNVAVTLFLLAGIFSFVAAFAAGTVPVGSFAVAAWAFSAWIGYLSVTLFPRVPKARNIWTLMLAVAAGSATMGYIYDGSGWLYLSHKGGWLMFLAIFVGIVGFIGFLVGLANTQGTGWQRWQDPSVAMGLDILGPFALAATLACMFGKYMPV